MLVIVFLALITLGEFAIASQPLRIVSLKTPNNGCVDPGHGSAVITISGGAAPYIYESCFIANVKKGPCVPQFRSQPTTVTQFTFASLAVTSPISAWRFSVTDSQGTTVSSQAVGIPSLAQIAFTAEARNPLCNGQNGSIVIRATGGNSLYQVSLNGGAFLAPQTSPISLSVPAGIYSILVSDTSGCPVPAPQQVTLVNPAPVTFTATATNPLCHNGMGTINIIAQGGTGSYSVSLNDAPFSAPQPSPISLLEAPGAYAVGLIDSNLCSGGAPQMVTIVNPTPVTFTFQKINAVDGQANGSIIVTSASGGTGMGYQASDGGPFIPVPATFANLSAGTYAVVARDSNLCPTDPPVLITIAAVAPLAATATTTPVDCAKQTPGSITVNATGGTIPYQYQLDSGAFQTSNVFNDVAAGAHSVTVLDADGRTVSTTATVKAIRSLTGDPVTDFISLVLCKGQCTTK